MDATVTSLPVAAPGPDLKSYDVILVNSSAGKDSQAMLDVVVEEAKRAGCLDRVMVVHCDLGTMEWEGTKELAGRQAAHYGLRFEVVRRELDADLLEYAERRAAKQMAEGKKVLPWPSKMSRWCTSEFKRAPVYKLMTKLANEVRAAKGAKRGEYKPRILNCMGLRAQESHDRATCDCCHAWTAEVGAEKKARGIKVAVRWVPVTECPVCKGSGDRQAFVHDEDASTDTTRHVDEWLPILAWKVEQVWDRIKKSGVEYHRAYDLGMKRLSCTMCCFAPFEALVLAGHHNKETLKRYVELEKKVGASFKNGKKGAIALVLEAVEAGTVEEATKVAAGGDDGCWGY